MKRPLKNLGAFLLGDGAARLIGFGLNIYLARILEPAGFGVISVGFAVLGYLLLAAGPGIQILETRNVAAGGTVDAERIGAVLALRLLLAVILWAVAAGIAVVAVDDGRIRASVILYGAAAVPLALFLDWFFAGREEFLSVGAARILSAAVYAGGVLLFVRSPGDLPATPLAFIAGAATASAMLAVLYVRRAGVPPLRWDPGTWKNIAVASVPTGVAVLLGQNVTSLPPIVVGAVAGAAAAGQFSAALKLIFALLMLDRVLNALLLPVMTRYAATRPADLPGLVAAMARSVIHLGVPLTILGALLAPWLVPMAFGPGYGEAVPLFRILLPYVGMTLISSTCAVLLLAAGRERRYTILMLRAAAVLVALVVGLTLLLGTEGAAWGVLAGEAAALVLLAREAGGVAGFRLHRVLARPLAVTVPLLIVFLFPAPASPAALAVVTLGIGLATLGIMLGNGREDVRFFRGRLL